MRTWRLLMAGVAALSLSACGNLLGPPAAGPIYSVRPDFAQGTGEKVNWALAIMHPDVPGGLETDRIALLQPDGRADYYAGATYPAPLSDTVQLTMLSAFEASGRVDAVSKEEDALHADYNLVIEVKDFEALYAQPDGIPNAQVTINAKLTTAHGRKILASFNSAQSVPASANNVPAVILALRQALSASTLAIVNWTLATAPPLTPALSAEAASPGKPAEELLHQTTRAGVRARTPLAPQ